MSTPFTPTANAIEDALFGMVQTAVDAYVPETGEPTPKLIFPDRQHRDRANNPPSVDDSWVSVKLNSVNGFQSALGTNRHRNIDSLVAEVYTPRRKGVQTNRRLAAHIKAAVERFGPGLAALRDIRYADGNPSSDWCHRAVMATAEWDEYET